MDHSKYLDVFKQELLIFLDELMLLLPDESELMMIKIIVQDVANMEEVIKYVYTKLVPLEDHVKNRDERFFLDHCVLFDTLDNGSSDKVDYFKRIWESETDEDNKEMIWNWFEHFIALSKKYWNR